MIKRLLTAVAMVAAAVLPIAPAASADDPRPRRHLAPATLLLSGRWPRAYRRLTLGHFYISTGHTLRGPAPIRHAHGTAHRAIGDAWYGA